MLAASSFGEAAMNAEERMLLHGHLASNENRAWDEERSDDE